MINLPCCNFQPDKYYISYSIDLYSASNGTVGLYPATLIPPRLPISTLPP
jgi:hypothetical protein